MRSEEELDGIKQLGSNKTRYEYKQPTHKILETFTNKHPDNDYLVSFKCPEFTSLCPKTGQPDFATITIQYIPEEFMVESKSLKLYLFSYRQHGDFHEDCTNKIMKDVWEVTKPKWVRVTGDFTPRGGISICTVVEKKRGGYVVPEQYKRFVSVHQRHKTE